MTLTADLSGKKDDETALFSLVDWSRTKAYGCGFSSIYFNLTGREGKGIVDPSETSALAHKLIERLRAYEDPATGKRPVYRVYTREEVYRGPELDDAPDLIVGFSPGYRMSWQTAVGGVRPTVLSPNEKRWSGDHIVDPTLVPGIIFTNVPLETTGARAEDLAPTVMSLLGVEEGADYDGEPLRPAEKSASRADASDR